MTKHELEDEVLALILKYNTNGTLNAYQTVKSIIGATYAVAYIMAKRHGEHETLLQDFIEMIMKTQNSIEDYLKRHE